MCKIFLKIKKFCLKCKKDLLKTINAPKKYFFNQTESIKKVSPNKISYIEKNHN